MNSVKLERQIKEDIKKGFRPFMVVSSMGTTGTGSIDPIESINEVSKLNNCWLHADAAYGGAVALNDNYRNLLKGISHADSITFDAHKWLSVPMSAGIFITKHPDILEKTFRIKADYMPKDAGSMDIQDPFGHSIQWSRRFTGLKVYMSLLMYGWEGWSELVENQIKKGQYLKDKLSESNWKIFNDTPLPVVCFGKESFEKDDKLAGIIAQKVVQTRKAWISVYRINELNTLRACVTNYRTSEKDLDELVNILNQEFSNL
jgi:glutamate/tyrosine decarboxylase-like PLP-dependent enzyme